MTVNASFPMSSCRIVWISKAELATHQPYLFTSMLFINIASPKWEAISSSRLHFAKLKISSLGKASLEMDQCEKLYYPVLSIWVQGKLNLSLPIGPIKSPQNTKGSGSRATRIYMHLHGSGQVAPFYVDLKGNAGEKHLLQHNKLGTRLGWSIARCNEKEKGRSRGGSSRTNKKTFSHRWKEASGNSMVWKGKWEERHRII